jgi:uroporphyrinogen decarboxylase
MQHLKEHYGFSSEEEVYTHFDIDIRTAAPAYTGPERGRRELEGRDYEYEGMFGEWRRAVWDGREYNTVCFGHPLDEAETADDVDSMMIWPKPEWFDYDSFGEKLSRMGDKAVIIGHWGPFQTSANLRAEEKLYMDMALNPDLAHRIFQGMHEFQMWHYRNMLEAGGGRIDILRTHDDYGTQRGMLFSIEMWRDYFKTYTRELADLAHRYGAFFQQHSCGAVRPVIPDLIECGVDSIEPIQPVEGMDPEDLATEFGRKITFCGGIDTQHLLPYGTQEEVRAETQRYVNALGRDGGYILYPSQAWESCVPIPNIEALYSIRSVS